MYQTHCADLASSHQSSSPAQRAIVANRLWYELLCPLFPERCGLPDADTTPDGRILFRRPAREGVTTALANRWRQPNVTDFLAHMQYNLQTAAFARRWAHAQ